MRISVLREEPRRPRTFRAVAAALVLLLSGAPGFAQISQTTSQVGPKSLHIDILEGEGALNNIRTRDAREPVIQVTDENHKPVAGVAVLFLINTGSNGAGATFAGGATTLTATTGVDGIAHAPGMQLTQTPGSFTVSVSASLGPLAATAVIHQSTVLTALSSTGASATQTAVQHGILHAGRTLAVTLGSAVAVGTVVGVVTAVRSTGTSLALGPGTVTHP